jgi:predicted phage tail protein
VPENAQQTDEKPDFGRGLYVCEKPGHEFVGSGSAGMASGLLGTQVFAMMFLVPVLGFYVLRNLLGVSSVVAGIIAGLVSVAVVLVGLVFLMKLNRVNRKQGTYLKNESDSRYRVRVVIPKKKQESVILKWAQLAVEGGVGDEEKVSEDELEMIRGGFEPMIVKPWFGINRDRKYWWTFVVMSIVVGASFLYGLTFLFGSWRDLMQSLGFLGYATMGLSMVGGVVSAEFIWPIYIRLVPGQLDIFRFGILGSGTPSVDSFDLREVGVCVDFGGYIISLEPARELGEALPALVQSKRWPNGKAFPEDYQPMYFSAAMVRSRRAFAQRLVQAARTDEPTPPVSMERLGE